MASSTSGQRSGLFAFYHNRGQVTQFVMLVALIFLIRTFVFGLYQVPTGSMETTMLVGERFFADKFTYLFSSPKRGHIISLNSPLFEYSSNPVKRLFEEYVWGPTNLTKRIIGIPGDEVEGRIVDGKPVVYLNGSQLNEPHLNKYPLIAVWKSDVNQLVKNANEEAISLLSQNKLSPQQFEQFMNRKLYQEINQRSYDPAVAYEKQPFYRIKESLIYKDQQGNPQITYPNTIISDPKQGNTPPIDTNYWDSTDVFHVKLGKNQYWLMGDNRLNSGDSRLFGPIDGRLIHGRILFRIFSLDSGDDWWIVDLIKHPIDFWTRIRWSRCLQFVA